MSDILWRQGRPEEELREIKTRKGIATQTKGKREKQRENSSYGMCFLLLKPLTGGKNQCPELEHCKYTVSKWTM